MHIKLAEDISIFVGSNNSGKTSATYAVHSFVSGKKENFTIYDFSSSCLREFDRIGSLTETDPTELSFPTISIDLWFEVSSSDLYLVIPLLTSTAWQGTQVGLRVEFSPRDHAELCKNFHQAQLLARSKSPPLEEREKETYIPWPKSMTDFLKKELMNEFELKYFVLDRAAFDHSYSPSAGYMPSLLPKEISGSSLLKSIIRVDNLNAQRHQTDSSSTSNQGIGRSEDLSKRLSRFYKRNLAQRQDDYGALRALSNSESGLNEHLADVFRETLARISQLGYPGLKNPRLEIKSALNPASVMSSQDARVHYVLGNGDSALRLPDTYNGLGFKNLIYMVVEILDLHANWVGDKEKRAPLHLIFTEEPEAHLHAQLQQVFIRNVLHLIRDPHEADSTFHSQAVVTTHSPHILYERGFRPIRYFKRQQSDDDDQVTEVLNLSEFYDQNKDERDFLERYLKLTHCDLFFADAAILVEGNVERLLLPTMIEKEAKSLQTACLSILEVGGAFGHIFKSLIEFLGVVTLIITDLDSVALSANGSDQSDNENIEIDNFEDDTCEISPNPTSPRESNNKNAARRVLRTCLPSIEGAETSNQTLVKWLPNKKYICDLLAASNEDKIHTVAGLKHFKVRVAYQVPTEVTWNGQTSPICGRTLEEAFGLENAEWCQARQQSKIGLKFRVAPTSPEGLASALHQRVTGKFDKTRFALGVLTVAPESWRVPLYIKEGLQWLAKEVNLEMPILIPELIETNTLIPGKETASTSSSEAPNE